MKGIEYFVKPGGKIVKQLMMSDEDKAFFEEEKRQFIEKYGRNPTQQEESVMREANFEDLNAVIAKDLQASGVRPEVLYAFQKTGILVTRENQFQVTPDELKCWQEAVEEYKANH